MKPLITAFLHELNLKEPQQLLQTADELKLDVLSLASVLGIEWENTSKQNLKDMQQMLKDRKMKVGILDLKLPRYRVDHDGKHKEALQYFKNMIKIADMFKSNAFFMTLPVFDDVMDQYPLIEQRIHDYLELAMQNHKKLIIVAEPGLKINVYAYIFKKIDSPYLQFHFDPVKIMNQGDSTITAYRHMKAYIGSFAILDANHDGSFELVGYGDANLTELLKKLSRDDYQGFFVMDHPYFAKLASYQPPKQGFLQKIFANEQKKHDQRMQTLAMKIFPNEQTRNVTYMDVLKNQIALIRLVFK